MTALPQPPGASVSFREGAAVVWVPRAPQHPAAGTAVGQAQTETPIEPAANPHPHIPFCRAALQPLLSQSVLVSGALLHPGGRIRHLDLLNFMPFMMTAQSTSLAGSFRKASHPSREPTAPPSLGSSANLLTMDSTPGSRSLINLWNIDKHIELALGSSPEEHHW